MKMTTDRATTQEALKEGMKKDGSSQTRGLWPFYSVTSLFEPSFQQILTLISSLLS